MTFTPADADFITKGRRKLEFTKNWQDLPLEVKNQLTNANVFYSSEWYAYNKDRKEEMIYLWDDSYIQVIRVKTVSFLKGGLLDTEPFCFSSSDSFETQQAFLNECCRVMKKNKLADWIQTEISANFLSYPTGAVVFGAGNYMITLENCSDEDLMQKMHSKNRNMIRRGQKEGITISRSGDLLLDDYKSVEDQVWERQGKPLRGLNHYRELVQNLPTCSSVAVAYNPAGEVEAGVFFLYTKAMGYYHHGASRTSHTIGAHNYLLFDQLCYLRDLGVKKVCFVGYRRPSEQGRNAKADNIQKFKERFSDEALQTFGFKVEFNKFHYKLYRIANMILRREQYEDLYDSRSRNYPEYNQKKR